MLTAAGFAVEGERTVSVNIDGSGGEAIGRYALGSLLRLRGAAAEDLTALDRLLDTASPHSVLRPDDLTVRTERIVWAARRP